ncbi:MAG: glycine--tRNA ligase subunit beta, partial [Nitrospinota bacterium]
ELLIEIRTEEIPAGYIPGALKSFKENFERLCTQNRIAFDSVHTFGTPRRLILYVEKIAASQESLESKIWGPPKKIAFDENGNPGKAALGFAKKTGAKLSELKTEKADKGEYLVFTKFEKGQKTKKVLPDLLVGCISAIRFPKSMRWGAGDFRFVRPIQSIGIVFAGSVVPLRIAGLKSSNVSVGHRFMAPREFTFKDFASYKKKLTSRYVIADAEERKYEILKESKKLARRCKGVLLEDSELSDTLAYLTEYPIPVQGSFEKGYLRLPSELLIAVMKKHQKYLAVTDSKGKLLPNFIAVSDNMATDKRVLRRGFEKVLKARLADAQYFYDEDRKKPLEKYTEAFGSVVWQKELGTLDEKVKRVVRLSSHIAGLVSPGQRADVERAAKLCKADLMTLMVYEFPELQGVIGRYYALASKEKRDISEAIYEHYLPRFSGDKLPQKTLGAIVGIADKIDTIAGCFSAGLIPSGSEDPLALRRQALGLMNIIIDRKWDISMKEVLDYSLGLVPLKKDSEKVRKTIVAFLQGRLKNQLMGSGVPYDVADAVFSVSFDNLCEDVKKVRAFSEVKKKSYFGALTGTFKRVSHIAGAETLPPPDPKLFKEEAEQVLYEQLCKVKTISIEFIEKKDYKGALRKIPAIRPHVDRFFDDVLVMEKNEELKANRLRLLSGVQGLFQGLADFSKIVTS